MQKLVRLVLSLAVVWYVLFGVVLALFEKRMVYFPDAQDFESCAGFLDAEKITYKGTRFYYKHIHDEKAVVFYHGNGGSACDRSVLKDTFEEAGFSYLFVEYPGYSADTHLPSKASILEDVITVRAFLDERGYNKVVPVGESLGTGPAAYHAYLGGVQKVILRTPYYEIADMVGTLGKVYPLRYMMRENFTPGAWMKDIALPILVIYVPVDEVIPYQSTKKLYDSLTSPEKKMVGIEHGTHNTLYELDQTFEEIRSFLLQ